MNKQSRVLVLDFGGQYNLLVARRVRECGVYCEIKPWSTPLEAVRAFAPDGIIFTGGPATVSEEGAPMIDPAMFALGVPVLGICRGIQVINAVLGGTLWQDLPKQRPSEVEHHGLPPYEEPVHEVDVLSSTPLAEAIGAGSYAVNSYHHQALRDLAPGLEAMAVAPDGVIEAVWRPESRFLWAVQWHPEFSRGVDEKSRKVFSAFVDAAREASDSGRGLL